MDDALRQWAHRQARDHSGVVAVGYFGSYARNAWGVGSDVDVIVVTQTSTEPFETRAVQWDASALPVPADVLVYTSPEFSAVRRRGDRFARMIELETVWVYGAPPE